MARAPVVMIYGVTASGKSDFALFLAKYLNGVVINTDAFQVYSDWHILTASPPQLPNIDRYLYNFVRPSDSFSVGSWLREVNRVLKEDVKDDRVPIFVGGTGLYFRALEGCLSSVPVVNNEFRLRSLEMLNKLGTSGLTSFLQDKDPDTANLIDCRNPARLLRACEVLLATGKGLAYWWQTPGISPIKGREVIPIVLNVDSKEDIVSRVGLRLKSMISDGVIDEVKRFNKLYPDLRTTAAKVIGYREFMSYLKCELSLNSVIDKVINNTVSYARRQITWKKKYMSSWISLDANSVLCDYEQYAKLISYHVDRASSLKLDSLAVTV